jgi:hypothetical protein
MISWVRKSKSPSREKISVESREKKAKIGFSCDLDNTHFNNAAEPAGEQRRGGTAERGNKNKEQQGNKEQGTEETGNRALWQQ